MPTCRSLGATFNRDDGRRKMPCVWHKYATGELNMYMYINTKYEG